MGNLLGVFKNQKWMSLLSRFVHCRGELSDVIDSHGSLREETTDIFEEVIISVEGAIPKQQVAPPRMPEYKDIVRELVLEEGPVFTNGSPDCIRPIRNMSRQDNRLRNKYAVSRERMANCLTNMEEASRMLYESRHVKREAKREDCLNIAHSLNDTDLQDVYSLYEKEFHREFDLELREQQLENRYKWSKSLVSKYRKDQLKIISHFKERKFIQLSQVADIRIRYPQDEMSIDLDLLEKRLPAEIVDVIGSYLTYFTRIQEMEDNNYFFNRVRYMSPKTSQYYLEYLMRFPEYYLVTEDEFVADQMYKELYRNNNRTRTSMEERKRRILYIYYKFRLYNEPAAYKMMREFSLLIRK
jgi:hypothetical protein